MQPSDLVKKVKLYEKPENVAKIKSAYAFAEKCHDGQKRATGEPYIEHPLSVACILADLKLDTTTIIAALLHDVIEDTGVTYQEVAKEFGDEVATLVEGVTKIQKLKDMSKEEYHAQTIQKVILASVKDIRILLIKLADRLHNMKSIGVFREEKRQRIARDALEIYAPIAHKLGIASIKWELEDLAFEQLNPEAYKEIRNKIQQSQKQREQEISRGIKILDGELAQTKIKYYLDGRTKHIYSIYRKMQKKSKSFEEIFDIAAIRIITDTVRHCYEILGIVHNIWIPIPKEFDDYIATPKSNMYQSLHTVVMGQNNKPVEIQIRTEDMHLVAERGIAAHWIYKGHADAKEFEQKLKWMREINELQQGSESAKEFVKMLHIDFFEDEMFAFTPKGKVIELPKGATVLDFAYAVHTELGSKCIAAKVNNKFVPLRAQVQNGDMVEILTSKNQHPSREWLKFVTTSKAASKIKQYIRSTQSVPVKSFAAEKEIKKELEEWIIDVDNMTQPEIKLSRCCTPLPGEKIIGYATKSHRVMIHQLECPIAMTQKGKTKKKVNVRWMDNIGRLVEVKVDARERTGLFAEILNTLIAINTPIKSTHAKPLGNDMVECSFEMETAGLAHLQNVIKRIKKIQGVQNVFIGNMVK